MANLTQILEAERRKICKIAKDCGLDFFETVFELVNYSQLNEIAAKGGFPTRYPHWRFGMEYEQLSKSHEYGLSKIYELVINTDPCYAYLMEGNDLVDQKLVMAHVYGHADFFKNNMWFSQTDRKMMDTMANNAVRVRRYIDKYGIDTVENFIDKCLSIENLIDRYSPYSRSKLNEMRVERPPIQEKEGQSIYEVRREYIEKFIKSSDSWNGVVKAPNKPEEEIFPPTPQKDILQFLMSYAPLEDWQVDVLSIIRSESYYFAPQGMTKIMNEGWASYWHSKILTGDVLVDSEIVDFADRHAGAMVMQPNGFNPYKIGIEIFREIEQRWNKGRYGMEWESCTSLDQKKNWDTKEMAGREKIFQVRRDYNDVTFIDEFLTEDFCVRNKMFVYKFNKRTNQFEIDTRDFKSIKNKLLFQLTNLGQPIISIVDGNFNRRGELLMAHLHEGVDLQPDYMEEALKNLYYFWQKPVSLATVMDGEGRIFTHDGEDLKSIPFSELPVGDQNADHDKEEKSS